MKTSTKILTLSAALTGLLSLTAQAQISVVDGTPLTPVQSGSTAGASVSDTFTVSASANALVVELFDRDSQNTTDPFTAGLTWNGGSPQTLTDAVGEPNGASSYSWVNIFYLYNPTPGTATITATDTAFPPQGGAMAMTIFDLTGVNTAVTPVAYAANLASGNSLSITTSAATPAGEFAALAASYGNGGNSATFLYTTSDSGTLSQVDFNALTAQDFGYELGLSGGATTITAADTPGGSTKMAEAGLVFAPTGVPEPATLALVGIGAALFGMFRFRKHS